jgi:ribose transport system substrate-binding protein
MHTRTRTRSVAATALVVVGILLASACSSGSSGESAVKDATSSSAQDALKAAFAGFVTDPPTVPTKPKPGVNVWIVSCGQQIPSCSQPTKGAMEAAKLVGWKATTCDGKLNPDGWGTCVRQGISAKADVILPIGLDCVTIQQPFEEAKKAGVKVVGAGGADCDATGGPKLWDSERLQLDGVSVKEYWEKSGEVAANYLIGSTDGKAKILQLKFTDPLWGPWLTAGFEKQMATCKGCEIVDTLDIANNDIANGSGVGKFSAALQKATTANAVYVPVGGWMPAGFAQAVASSGRQSNLVVATGFGDAANMELIRSNGGQDAVLGYSTEWGAWGSIDTAIRVMNSEKPEVEGDGFQMVDGKHNLPPKGQDYQGSADFKSAYKKLWGVS